MNIIAHIYHNTMQPYYWFWYIYRVRVESIQTIPNKLASQPRKVNVPSIPPQNLPAIPMTTTWSWRIQLQLKALPISFVTWTRNCGCYHLFTTVGRCVPCQVGGGYHAKVGRAGQFLRCSPCLQTNLCFIRGQSICNPTF